MKKIYLSFLLIFSLFFFCSCRPQNVEIEGPIICSGLAFEEDGQIVQRVGIGVDSETLDKIATQNEKVLFSSRLVEEMDLLRQKFVLSFAVTYLENPVEEMKIGKGVKIGQCLFSQEEDLVSFEIIFSSSGAWEYYHKQTSSGAEKQPNILLLEKKESRSTFPFAQKDSTGEVLGESYKKLYLSAAKGLNIEKHLQENYSPSFVYIYSVPYSSLRSDADFRVKDDEGLYSHIWIEQEKDLQKENKICIYYYKANKGVWILLALAVPCAALAIYLIVIKIKAKKCKN